MRFSNKGPPPSTTVIQKSLSILIEISIFSLIARALRISYHIVSINMAENRATFIKVFIFFESYHHDKKNSNNIHRSCFAKRSKVNQDLLTKDLYSSKRFILIFNYICFFIQSIDHLLGLPLLFVVITDLQKL